jgi:hypothetical protein
VQKLFFSAKKAVCKGFFFLQKKPGAKTIFFCKKNVAIRSACGGFGG